MRISWPLWALAVCKSKAWACSVSERQLIDIPGLTATRSLGHVPLCLVHENAGTRAGSNLPASPMDCHMAIGAMICVEVRDPYEG